MDIKDLEKLGASRWVKVANGRRYDRLYLNDSVYSLVGLRNTGNVAYAELDGKEISNCSAREIIDDCRGAYIDMVDGSCYAPAGWVRKIMKCVLGD